MTRNRCLRERTLLNSILLCRVIETVLLRVLLRIVETSLLRVLLRVVLLRVLLRIILLRVVLLGGLIGICLLNVLLGRLIGTDLRRRMSILLCRGIIAIPLRIILHSLIGLAFLLTVRIIIHIFFPFLGIVNFLDVMGSNIYL